MMMECAVNLSLHLPVSSTCLQVAAQPSNLSTHWDAWTNPTNYSSLKWLDHGPETSNYGQQRIAKCNLV